MSAAKKCINCQVLGMQKAIDAMIAINPKKAIELAKTLNKFILSQSNFSRDAEHIIDVRKDENGKYFTVLTGKNHGPEGKTKERLISLFEFDRQPGEPKVMRWNKLGRAREYWKADLPALKALMKDGLVKVVHQDRKTITYQYTPKV